MRYPPDQKTRTRQLIAEAASRALRHDGIAATGILPLMRGMGLTPGAFYKNFVSRDDLLIAALTHAADEVRGFMAAWAAAAGAGDPLARIIGEYLSERHLDSLERGCPVASLGPELYRQSQAVRQHADGLCEGMFEHLASHMLTHRRGVARPLYLLMAATVASARLASDRDEQFAILAGGRLAAAKLAGLDERG